MPCGIKKFVKYEIINKEKIPYNPVYPMSIFSLDLIKKLFEKNKPNPIIENIMIQ